MGWIVECSLGRAGRAESGLVRRECASHSLRSRSHDAQTRSPNLFFRPRREPVRRLWLILTTRLHHEMKLLNRISSQSPDHFLTKVEQFSALKPWLNFFTIDLFIYWTVKLCKENSLHMHFKQNNSTQPHQLGNSHLNVSTCLSPLELSFDSKVKRLCEG